MTGKDELKGVGLIPDETEARRRKEFADLAELARLVEHAASVYSAAPAPSAKKSREDRSRPGG